MNRPLKEMKFPKTGSYHTDTEHPPIELYLDIFPRIKSMDLELGYFSSTAFSVLSFGMAQFIQNGGVLRIISNSQLSESDSNMVFEEKSDYNLRDSIGQLINDNNRLEELQRILKKRENHFFDCLLFLRDNGRLFIQPVQPKRGGIAHNKRCVVSDGENEMYFSGSANFTGNALKYNSESIDVSPDWKGDIITNKERIKEFHDNFNQILNKTHKNYKYLIESEIDHLISTKGVKKDLYTLIDEELNLDITYEEEFSPVFRKIFSEKKKEFQDKVDEIERSPHFPIFDGVVAKPRPYQVEAYKAWVKNDYKGIFAMATGTGKTITSLNCVLNEFMINKYYKFIVLVPTVALGKQWINEVKCKFNFQNTVLCCSANRGWKEELKSIGKNIVFRREINYAIITTYASFKGINFQTIFKEYFINDFDKITIIADEAHTMGSQGFIKVMPNYLSKRIGLSATPERQFDEVGNTVLSQYFSTSEDEYTFEYNMKKAIDNKVLCKYYYYPRIVSLEKHEQDEYLKISKKLSKHIDYKTGKYKESDYVNILLLKRKNVIHKASRKVNELVSIVKEIGKDNFKNAFIYVPEGVEFDYADIDDSIDNVERDNSKLIDNYLKVLYDNYGLRMVKFTGETKNRDQILDQFKSEKLDVLLAMKCLDEGVDIPQTKFAIFCSSTGNPRQYIQRRGRVLRNFKDKDFAIIYDLIVSPVIDYTDKDEKVSKIEKSIFLSELRRLVNFSVLSENKDSCLKRLEQVCYDRDIDIYKLANEELDKYK